MKILMKIIIPLAALAITSPCHSAPVTTVEQLASAIREGAEGSIVEIGAGTFELPSQISPKRGMTLKGAGMDRTILTHAAGWRPSTSTLPDPEMMEQGLDTSAYLIRLPAKAADITISDLTLSGPQLHGAIYGWGNENLRLQHLHLRDFLWAGIRTFEMKGARIEDCIFTDAGGRWEKGQPGEKGGITGGAIFAIWMKDTEISHCRFIRTQTARPDEFYGIKVRQAKRCRIHHNTIGVNFSMEFPFENDEDVEIDHNICDGTISIPKHAGGPVPASGSTFHIHHNLFRDTYSIEFVRNGVEIDHNLFDFDPAKDHGNTISGFGKAAAPGPAVFHNNLVANPGRGVIWINEPYDHLTVRNNHIITRTTTTPRTEGLFGFAPGCDFTTHTFRDNIIECIGQARPLFRNEGSAKAMISNNALTNISDTGRYTNNPGTTPRGLEAPLSFECGVHGEMKIDGWKTRPTAAR